MAQANLEHDPLFELLTDALRAGPESPQWREAVQRVREADSTIVDEFGLLSRARERLAQGREYRSLRAGPTFTRRVMDRIEEEASQAKSGVPWASVIAVFSLIIMVGAVAGIIYLLQSSSPKPAGQADHVFEAQQPFSVEISSDVPPAGANPIIVVVQPVGSTGSGLTVQWRSDGVRVDGDEGTVLNTKPIRPTRRLKLEIDRALAKIEADGTPVWSGRHGLPEEGSRAVDVRVPPAIRPQIQVDIVRLEQQEH